MAAVADNQLHAFMDVNERRRAAGQKPELLLDTGAREAWPLAGVVPEFTSCRDLPATEPWWSHMTGCGAFSQA